MIEEGSESKKKNGKMKWIIMLLILLLLGGGGYYAYTTYFQDSAETPEQQDVQLEPADSSDSQIITLPTFLVNLSDPLGRRYIKLTLDVEVASPDAAQVLENAGAKVRDAVILLLSSKSYADLASLESKLLLKNELVTRLNQIIGSSKVVRVYFTELVIQ
ncbi:flagellar basal body-associated protein FliL [Halodesulfovibrio sp.]|uniref:flagellar basal body-associated FliL family protein n=1 Tax=Halodesulfovibrio sp. TaxID=1912772 RepID=UPI0025FE1A13|nr:flagellar basal body-associated FliL family protein [Halodesulfovibrio sp.]MCT4535836.1 flagellar basal body-associated FliL family protein [Halodesulfovibrio sp.]MCT4627672.1 flagellar basal body-associated FliL family protein [Halodesulfovibrio sp.]